MDRREFLAAMAAVPVLGVQPRPIPDYRIVTNYKPAAQPGMRARIAAVWSPCTRHAASTR